MRFKLLSVIVTAIFLIAGCHDRMGYWPLSKFKMRTGALKDGEPIKLIYTSTGRNNNNFEFFIHVIAVSQLTGDTVNILTPEITDLTQNDGDEVFRFISDTSSIGRALLINLDDLSPLEKEKDLEKLKKADLSKIKLIIRDKNFDEIADNQHPTVIGWFGRAVDSVNTTINITR